MDTDPQHLTEPSYSGCEWSALERLAGHEDWVSCLDTVQAEQGALLLASGGQDSTIRYAHSHIHHEN